MSLIDLSKALYGSTTRSSKYTYSTNSTSNVRYGTVTTASNGTEVGVTLDGSSEEVILACQETLFVGTRVTVFSMGGTYKVVCLTTNADGSGTLSGDLLRVDTALVEKLYADEAFITDLHAETIEAVTINADQVAAVLVQTETLQAETADIVNAEIKNAKIDAAQITDLDVVTAEIVEAEIKNATIDVAQIANLEAEYAKIDFANVDTAAISEAWVDSLMIQGSFVAQSGTTYWLTALHIDANDITAGTLTVDRLNFKGEDGIYYQLNLTSLGELGISELTEEEQLACQTQLHAESIIAHTITAEQLTVNNIVGTGGWINLAEGTFEYTNAKSGSGIIWDGETLTIRGDALTVEGTDVIAALQSVEETADAAMEKATSASASASSALAASSAAQVLADAGYDLAYAVQGSLDVTNAALSELDSDTSLLRTRIKIDSNGVYILDTDLKSVLAWFAANGTYFSGSGAATTNPDAYFGTQGLEIPTGKIAQFGSFAIVPRSDGHTAFKWIG